MSLDKIMLRAGNAMMRQRISHMAAQPYRDGQPAYRVVAIRGRQSGQLRPVPLAVFQYAEQRYLIAPTRQRDWVRNLVAAGHCEIAARNVNEHYAATLTDDAAAVAAVQAYRKHIGNGMGAISSRSPSLPHSPRSKHRCRRWPSFVSWHKGSG